MDRWSLRGATALVTGGTKGIGHAIVEELARLGAAVYTCSRNEAELQQCLRRWEAAGLTVRGSACDVSSSAAREELMERVKAAFDAQLNILINNAGSGPSKLAMEHTTEDYNWVMSTNLESAFHLGQLSHPLLKASGGGTIIFNSSITSCIGIDYYPCMQQLKLVDNKEFVASYSTRATWRARGCGIGRCLFMSSCFSLYQRPSYLC